MRLADFILSNIETILAEWEAFARGTAPGAAMDSLALRDHAEDILRATASDMASTQSATYRDSKSKGQGGGGGGGASATPVDGHDEGDGAMALNGASEAHAVGRLGSGFDLLEVVSEYRALRASVLRLWRDSGPRARDSDVDDVTRFNESIDQSITKAVSSYTKRVEQSRDLFLAILGHDLRNPLNSIAMSAAFLHKTGEPAAEATGVASQIARNADVMARMIGDLLDYTRTRLGVGMPVSPTPVDLASLCRDLFNEFRTAHPTREMTFACAGDVTGTWDADRLRQAVSNLMGNAVQHGDPRAPVDLKLRGEASDVVIVIHSGGPPIPPGELTKIFDPLVRGSGSDEPLRHRAGSIGLGLYIAREIARSHGGGIDVTSTQGAGTTFTVHLPRHPLAPTMNPILDEAHMQKM
jgi:signal transduction histidine kinase